MTVSVDALATSPERTAQLAALSARLKTDGSMDPSAAGVQPALLNAAAAGDAVLTATTAISLFGAAVRPASAVAAITMRLVATARARNTETRPSRANFLLMFSTYR